MRLEKSLFDIDASAYVERLCDFVRGKQAELHREGVLVPLSGGLDSSTVLLLCLQAVGKEQVTALLLPEKQGNPQAVKFARLVADRFGVATLTHDISPLLKSLGVYDFILNQIPTRALKEITARTYLHAAKANPFLALAQGQADALQRKGFALFNAKQRLRAAVTFMLAEEMNLMVAGAAHKSEDMVGLYVKFGVDDNADIMPLKNLFRSHILQIAVYLGVPEEILQRTPNPDIIPGVVDKYVDILGLPSDTLDLLVYGVEHGLTDEDIASQLKLEIEKVQEIRNLMANTDHMRHPSQSLEW